MSGCVFCAIAAGRTAAEMIVQEEDALAFLDIRPLAPGHTLVIPRRHVATIFEMDEVDAAATMCLAVRVSRALQAAVRPDGLRLVQNNGRAAGQDVFHAHLHLIPRWLGGGPHPTEGIDLRSASLTEVARWIRAGLAGS